MEAKEDLPAPPPEAVVIREARKSLGLSMRRAATEAGISEGRWRQIENGYQTVSKGNVIPVRGPVETLARMAFTVEADPAAFVEIHREDIGYAMEVYRDYRRPGSPESLNRNQDDFQRPRSVTGRQGVPHDEFSILVLERFQTAVQFGRLCADNGADPRDVNAYVDFATRLLESTVGRDRKGLSTVIREAKDIALNAYGTRLRYGADERYEHRELPDEVLRRAAAHSGETEAEQGTQD